MRASSSWFALPLLVFVACGAPGTPPPSTGGPPAASVPVAAPGVGARPAVATDRSTAPPATRRDDVHETLHGVDIVDPYRWLEDQESPETRAWITAQSAYTHGALDGRPERAVIRGRLEALTRVDDRSTPFERGGRLFTLQRRAGDDLWTSHVAFRDKGEENDEIWLDPHPLSDDHTTDAFLDSLSEDGALAVYAIRRGGEDETELRVREIATKKDRADVLPRALYRGVSMDHDKRGFSYALQDRAKGIRIRHHVLGKPNDTDVEVFGDGHGPNEWVDGWESRNGKHMIFTVGYGWAKNDIYVQSPPRAGKIVPIVVGKDARFEAAFAGDRLLMKTDLDAPTRRIVEVDPAHPSPDKWRNIVPAGADAINDWALAGGRIIVTYLHDVASRLVVYAMDGKVEGDLPLPGIVNVRAVNGRWEADEIFVGYTSFTTPRVTLRGSVSKRILAPWWKADVPFAGDDYETKQVWVTSKDGTKVPMFVVAKKGMALDGSHPTLLSGYGGFDRSLLPQFSPFDAWFLEQGGVYAQPNLRGGGELGEGWHKAGMLANKQNVFDDFLASAEWLVANKITTPDRLAIQGRSNGGLLVGAALTQRPDLFRAVLCEFPDLDMIGYHRFKNNNPPALLEYGDASKPDEFKFLYAYSPYQKVSPGTRYPAVLLTTGDEDTRVPPLQARKMTARLQAATSSGRPVFLLYDTKAGHAGGRSITKYIDDDSLEASFLAWQLGMTFTK